MAKKTITSKLLDTDQPIEDVTTEVDVPIERRRDHIASQYANRSSTKGGPRRTWGERERDMKMIADLYLKGFSMGQIANIISERNPHYKISRATVSNDVKEIQKRWMKSSLIDFNMAKAQELARLDLLEKSYWEGWERSLEKVAEVEQESTESSGTGGSHQKTRVKRKATDQLGNVDYLKGIERCIEQRCKILGLFDHAELASNWRTAAAEAGIPDAIANAQFEAMVTGFVKELSDSKEE